MTEDLSEARSARASPEGKRKAPVLVVEDDEDVRETLAIALEIEGYAVETAAHGKEALDRLHEMVNRGGDERPCLILLDLMMPVMSGAELLSLLRSDPAFATIPVVVVSAWDREAAKVAPDAQGLVRKPVDLTELLACVEEYCRDGGGCA